MKSKTIRFFSLFVTLAVLISTMQVTLAVIATDIQADENSLNSSSIETVENMETADTTPYETVAYVVGEDESLRKENEKHFRMSDGSYIAAVYPEAVHYLDNGEWEEIDNTLVQTEGGYRNASNDFTVMFSSDNSSTELYTITYGEHSVAMYYRPYSSGNTSLYALRPADTKHITVHETDENCEVFNVNSTADSVKEYRENNPGATEEQISEVVKAQNDENRRQRDYALQPKNLDSSLEFADILGNVDIEYAVTPSSVKENIILESASDGNVFEFILETDLAAVLNDDGTLDLMDDEELIFTMPAPYMYDANGEVSYDVQYSVSSVSSGILLTVTADDEWLDSEDRAFPVTIDPTVSSGKTDSSDWNIITDYISDNDLSTSNQGGAYWPMGCDADEGNFYAYMKVNYLPDIPYNCKYTSASISMYMYSDGFVANGAATFNVMVQEALSSWKTQFGSAATTNSNPIIDYYKLTSSHQGKRVSFDITNAAVNWYNDGTNNGLVFTSKLTNGNAMTSSDGACAIFKGYVNNSTETEYMPFFCVSYRNYIGVEGYLSYHEVDAGRAGHAYISDYTGNLTISRSLVSGTGFELKYIYNSPYGDRSFTSDDVFNTVAYTNMKSANGWRLNVQQSVVEKSLTQYDGTELVSTPYLIYSDEDGTEHYFAKTGEKEFKDEDGLGLTVTKSTDGKTYTMKDEKDRQWIFIYGYLSQMIDSNGNMVVLLYDTTTYSSSTTTWHPKNSAGTSQNQLKRIVYVPDGGSAITIATLTYDSTTKRLTSITDRASRKIEFTVSSAGYMTRIKDPDGYSAYYIHTADPSRIKAAYDDEADYGLTFEYHTKNKNTIMSYCDFTGSDVYNDSTWTIQNKLYASYDTQLSRFRHTGADQAVETDDDILSMYVFDTFGRTITVRSEDNGKNTLGAAGGTYTANSATSKTNNKILKEGGTGAIGQNLLSNSGFEANTNWTLGRADTTNYNGAFVSGQKHTGSQAYQIISNAAGGWMSLYQSIALPRAGYYTFSAYVKVTAMGDATASGSGIRISIKDSSDSNLATSRYIKSVTSTNIDNGWVRLTCTYEATATATVKVCLTLSGVTGTVYVDDAQFERNEVASPYNLVQNGSFTRNNTYWTSRNNATYASVTQYDGTTGYAMKITGGPEKGNAHAAQTINVNLPGSETYILSGWAKADSVPLNNSNQRTFQITAMFTYSDGTTDYAQNPFSYLVSGQWQYICVPVVPDADKTVTSVTVTCSYKGNANIAYFDDISLIRESSQAYTYDTDGNVVAVNKTNTDEISSVYEGGNLMSSAGGANGTYTYTYDDYHNVKTAKNGTVTMSMTYDTYGNATSTKLTGDSSSLYMSSSATYTDGGTKLYTITDNLGNVTRNTYNNSRNLLTGIVVTMSNSLVSNGSTYTTKYTYDSADRMNSSYMTNYVSVDYGFTKGEITSITRGGYEYYGDTNKVNQVYSFTRNALGLPVTTKVGDYTLSIKSYDSATNNLKLMLYGSNGYVAYTYDNLDRIKTERYNSIGLLVTYSYDYMGNVAQKKVTNTSGTTEFATYRYEYDSLGRPVRFFETVGDTVKQQIEYTYDSKNRPTSVSYFDGAEMRTETAVYNTDGTVSSYTLGDGGVATKSYDSLNRYTNTVYDRGSSISNAYNVVKRYSYKAGSEANQTTELISKLTYDFVSGTDVVYNYTYDNIGNITEVTDSSGNILGRYMYDRQNQLVFEEVYNGNSPYTMAYEYDTYGNIRSAKKYNGEGMSYDDIAYATPVATETYSYTDSSWHDLLTAYNGTSITYDTMGNPLSYYNGQSYTFTWEDGNQLASAVTGGNTVTFDYNSDGIRTAKYVAGEADYYYRLNGTKVVEMVMDSDLGYYRFVFVYDEYGSPYGFDLYEGETDTTPTKYYYVLNLQGDVVQLRNSSNGVVANYTYDAWGKLLSVTNASGSVITNTNHFAYLNPIRYRGYFYDTETKLYYCNSRYYDPQIKRFINAESNMFAGGFDANAGFLGYNVFCYCANNPVTHKDDSGQGLILAIVVGAVVGAVGGFIGSVASDKAVGEPVDLPGAFISAGIGAIEGGLTVVLPQYCALISATANAADSVIDDLRDGSSAKEIVVNATISAGIGGIVGSAGSDFVDSKPLRDIAENVLLIINPARPLVRKIAAKGTIKAFKKIGLISGINILQDSVYSVLNKWMGKYANLITD